MSLMIIKEPSRWVVILGQDTIEFNNNVDEICSRHKQRFNQDSVLQMTTRLCMSSIDDFDGIGY
jgi:hypothetical protein